MQLKSISLFTGIGGLDHGFEAAGFRTVIATDNDPFVLRTLRASTRWRLVDGDINRLSPTDLKSTTQLETDEIDMLLAGPPCQPFSKAAYWSRDGAAGLRDPRARTLQSFIDAVSVLRPRAFLLENVPGFAHKGDRGGLNFLLERIADINQRLSTNYSVSWAELNAADYGIPQIRKRVFVVASRDGRPFLFPAPTHAPTDKTDLVLEPYRTAWDAIGDLPQHSRHDTLRPTGKWADLLPSIPEGHNYLWHTSRGGGQQLFGWRTRYWSFLLKLAKNRPSWTIQSQTGSATGPFHWSNRRLSTEELCRLQTLPDSLLVEAPRTEIQRMIGNAVPSLLAEVLAREIRRQCFGDTIIAGRPLQLLPPRRPPPPRRHPVRPVPNSYLELIGNHEDHPGTGLGPAGRRTTIGTPMM